MEIKKNVIMLFLVLSSFFEGTAQVTARVKGLESDSVYMSLLLKEKSFLSEQDSLNNLIKDKRVTISTIDGALREKLSTEIMELETRQFDIRGTLGELSAKTSAIEKEYLLKNMNADVESGVGVDEKKNLVQNSYYKATLAESDYDIILNAVKSEKQIEDFASEVVLLYDSYKRLNEEYRSAGSKAEADSLKNVLNGFKENIHSIDNELGKVWSKLYQTKIDSYNQLLDKLSMYDKIESFGYKSRDKRSEISEIQTTVIAPQLAGYLRGKLLLNEYELVLADAKKLLLAKDSITSKMKNIDVKKFDFELIKLPNWVFVNFEPLKIGTTTIYNAENEIPSLMVSTKGDLFKINIGTYPKKQTSYAVFRKISPLEYREEQGGKFSYFAGSYKTFEDAKKDYDRLKRLGMKVSIAHWKDGNQIAEDGSIIDIQPVGDGFNVEFDDLTDAVHAIIKEKAQSMEIMKSVNGYSVGLFNDYVKAKEVATAIGVGAKVVGVKLDM